MRTIGFIVALMLLAWSPVRADPPKVAVFDFELLDTSLQGEVEGPRADEQRRLMNVSEQLRRGLAETGKFVVVDIAPVNAAAHASNLQACGGCDVQYAQQLGADLSITGLVQKVSAPHSQHEYLPAGRSHRTAHYVHERRLSQQYRRILVAYDELFAAKPAARA